MRPHKHYKNISRRPNIDILHWKTQSSTPKLDGHESFMRHSASLARTHDIPAWYAITIFFCFVIRIPLATEYVIHSLESIKPDIFTISCSHEAPFNFYREAPSQRLQRSINLASISSIAKASTLSKSRSRVGATKA